MAAVGHASLTMQASISTTELEADPASVAPNGDGGGLRAAHLHDAEYCRVSRLL